MTTAITVSSLVLYTRDLDRAARFYRSVGVPLEHEDHDEGPAHFAAELGDLHFAIYSAPGHSAPDHPDGAHRSALPWRSPGSDFPGFYVPSLDAVVAALTAADVVLLDEHETMPWGCRIVAQDPDGRAVEIIERDHCAEEPR